ncbi:CLOCK-interacting pacemaker-like isoform X1 [Solea solea]|uniref:CLOCK-interacting pacemaker-like isoform X1 n=2 Tax=Solea solea TaxID=90069 RepID=UPI00272A18D9|nr:CLOCK-interacting pacemaker-like isoform X1 [Solea solea]
MNTLAGSSMPKEQPRLSEQSPCDASSKNAKDKSNSTTLQAICDTKDTNDCSGTGSHCSSEKDSGYSECSDWQQTDVEDQHSNKSQSRGSECTETPQSGQNQNREHGQGNPGTPPLIPAGRDLRTIYVVKNMMLKQQPDTVQKSGQLLWKNKSKESGNAGAPHMILCQQPILLPTALQLHKPLSRNPNVTGKKVNDTYFPILNSYPRIAPHPSKKPPDKPSSNDESQNLSKRVYTEHKSDSTTETTSLLEQHLHKQPKLAASASGQPCTSTTRDTVSTCSPTASSSQCSSSVSPINTPTSTFLATRGLRRFGSSNFHHRRFLNTVEILRQSGLLDITLRTKELLRQSSATEQNIAQLRQHTELLCQAAHNPSSRLEGITPWEHLHRTMAESSNYPNLKILQELLIPTHQDSPAQPGNVVTGEAQGPFSAENPDVPPSHLLNTMLNLNHTCPLSQNRELDAAEKNMMPPDSSTG